ncbi:MAG: hypothetical protein Q4E17_07170 [Synergistes sp.]|nr:hypothetical protein [Synergistes sp.]
MDYFMIERLMGLFWVFIQLFSFCAIKYAYTDILENKGLSRTALLSSAVFFCLLVVYSFMPEFGMNKVPDMLIRGENFYFPWSVRIILCAAMIMFDALLVLYFARIVRIYRGGRRAARNTLSGDCAVAAFCVLLAFFYITGGISACEKYGFSMDEYLWIGRFFILLSNFFYITLEVSGAVMIMKFLNTLKGEAA